MYMTTSENRLLYYLFLHKERPTHTRPWKANRFMPKHIPNLLWFVCFFTSLTLYYRLVITLSARMVQCV